MQRKFKDSVVNFDSQSDSWKSKSVANIFGGTIGQLKNQTAKLDSFERSFDSQMKKNLFESLAGSHNGYNTPTRGRILTESEKRRKENVNKNFRDRFCSESS